MTCIIGLVSGKKVYIGGDSAEMVGDYDYHIREDEKVFKKNDMIFGFTSSFRMGQLLRYSFSIPTHDSAKSDFAYLCTTFVDELIKCFKDKGYAETENGVVSGGVFLLGYRGHLYQIQNDFQVSIIKKPFHTCGCGEQYAMGAMEAMSDDKELTPEERINKALKVAESFSSGVLPPFNLVSIGTHGPGRVSGTILMERV